VCVCVCVCACVCVLPWFRTHSLLLCAWLCALVRNMFCRAVMKTDTKIAACAGLVPDFVRTLVVVLVVGSVGAWMLWSLLSSFVDWQVCYARLV
jgi:hypothetical protein